MQTMETTLFFLCPTDCLESKLTKNLKEIIYFILVLQIILPLIQKQSEKLKNWLTDIVLKKFTLFYQNKIKLFQKL